MPFYLLLGGAAALAFLSTALAYWPSVGSWVFLVAGFLGIATFVFLCWLPTRITREYVPICPHCGVATNPASGSAAPADE